MKGFGIVLVLVACMVGMSLMAYGDERVHVKWNSGAVFFRSEDIRDEVLAQIHMSNKKGVTRPYMSSGLMTAAPKGTSCIILDTTEDGELAKVIVEGETGVWIAEMKVFRESGPGRR